MAMIKKKPAAAAKPEFKLNQRLGTFVFEADTVNDMPEIATKVMAGVLVLQCTFNPRSGEYEYLGVSEHFEGVPDGEAVPTYDVAWDDEKEEAAWTKAE